MTIVPVLRKVVSFEAKVAIVRKKALLFLSLEEVLSGKNEVVYFMVSWEKIEDTREVSGAVGTRLSDC